MFNAAGYLNFKGCAMTLAVFRHGLKAATRVQSHASLCTVCSGQSGSGIAVSLTNLFLPCQYHSNIFPYSFSHLWPTLCIVDSALSC